MKLNLSVYCTFVFDCDGVVLDSNKVKTQAFYLAALPYGEPAAKALVDYHVEHGGESRYKKFAYFLDTLVPEYATGVCGPGFDSLLVAYAAAVRHGLFQCTVTEGLVEFRAATPGARWLIVSGGDQVELRALFAKRGIADLFDGGIFGSPDTKDEILTRELANAIITPRALFIGDSRYDYVASAAAGLDFVFVSQWTELPNWQNFCTEHHLTQVHSIKELLPRGQCGS